MKVVKTEKAPQPVGWYSQGIRCGDFIFVSGQVAINPKTGRFVGKTVEKQATQSILNIKAILEMAGSQLDDVVKISVFHKNIRNWKAVDKIIKRFFRKNPPVRTSVGSNFAVPEILVEIDAVAYVQA